MKNINILTVILIITVGVLLITNVVTATALRDQWSYNRHLQHKYDTFELEVLYLDDIEDLSPSVNRYHTPSFDV